MVFALIEWPDKATRDAAKSRMGELMKTDDRVNPEKPMPFDTKRTIYRGFVPSAVQDRPKAEDDAIVRISVCAWNFYLLSKPYFAFICYKSAESAKSAHI